MNDNLGDSVLQGFPSSPDDMEDLCREPTLKIPEYTGMNSAFGIGTVLRKYASLDETEPLTFGCDHGVHLNPDFVYPLDDEHGLPGYLAPYQERADFLKSHGKLRVVDSAFPIHYARKVMWEQRGWRPPKSRSGTLVFPHKSSNSIDVSFDFSEFAQWLVTLPGEFQPVCVCIYVWDYLKGRHLPYQELGLPVVTCGHNASPRFLFRFVDLCSRFKYSCSNAVEGSYSLSVACGCHFFYKSTGTVRHLDEGAAKQSVVVDPGCNTKYGAELMPLAPYPPKPELLPRQRKLAAYLTGEQHILSPRHLQELQSWGRSWLLDHQPDALSFVEIVPPRELNKWLPIRVRNDGWAGPECRVVIKSRPQERSFELFFKLSPRICDGYCPVRVSFGNREQSFPCAAGRFRLVLPIASNEETGIWIRLSEEVKALEKIRGKKALRILGWRILSDRVRRPGCAPISRRLLPEFVATPEGW